MTTTYPDLPNWKFEIDEVSAGVYEVVGRHKLGMVVSSKGFDPDELLGKCRNDAKEVEGKFHNL